MARDIGRVVLRAGNETISFTSGPTWVFGSASYWVSQCKAQEVRKPQTSFAVGEDMLEETAFCLLGGFGMPAEVGIAAFDAVKRAGLLRIGVEQSAASFRKVLLSPMPACDGTQRPVRYRFPSQRADRLAAATRVFATQVPPLTSPAVLREWLCRIPGVGLKTASWIVRNSTGCDDVAIIDIHVWRAGLTAGFFPSSWKLPRDYYRFEEAFLEFARWGQVPSAVLDSLIWNQMRDAGSRVMH